MKKRKGKNKAHGKGHHTGHIRPKDMTSLLQGVGGSDPHASPEHLAANDEHDMPEGMQVSGEYDGDGMPGQEGNCC